MMFMYERLEVPIRNTKYSNQCSVLDHDITTLNAFVCYPVCIAVSQSA